MDANALVVGDLNGDGRTGHRSARRQRLALLPAATGGPHSWRAAENSLFRHAQGRADRGRERRRQGRSAAGGLGQPDAIPFPAAKWGRPARPGNLFQDAAHPLVLRGQSGGKQPNLFVVTIAQNSGRAEVSQFTRKPAEALSGAFRQGQFQVLPLQKTDAAQRGVLWADVNGDGLPGFARGRAGKRPDLRLFAKTGWFAGAAEKISDAGRRQPDRGGGLERRRPSGNFPVEP